MFPRITHATTIETNTRPEVAQMAGLWEVDSIEISSLANAQYPAYSPNNWEYIVPHSSIAADGDVHLDMATSASGAGSSGNNAGASPIVGEVINATGSQLTHLKLSSVKHSKVRGIFRLYTEHAGERHFEIHPMTGLWTNNGGSVFGLNTDYHTNITVVGDGATHPNSTLIGLFNGSRTLIAQVMADNTRVVFTYSSPLANYVQYDGVALSGVLTDSVSTYFLFRPDLVPAAAVRCRIVTNTAAAVTAAGFTSNQTVTVNALTRTDLLIVSNQIASLSANQSSTNTLPVELITLSVSSTGIVESLPIITDVQAVNITRTNATIQWTTDTFADSSVFYGTDQSFVTNVVSAGGSVTNHSVTVGGLVRDTLYYFDVSSTSTGGTTSDDNQGSDYSFTTQPCACN
jgi:hypothetical protein